MASNKCLICDQVIQDGNGINAHIGKFSKKSRISEGNIPLLSDAKSKFALTSSQCSILERVLTLPSGNFKSDLINGPYCRECFTNVNNVCHCMSALENLQQSVIEFRKDFGKKMQRSIISSGGVGHISGGSKKRKSNPSGSDDLTSVRSTIIRYLSNSVFPTDFFPTATDNDGETSKPSKHIHEIISNMDPNGSPDTNVDAKLILRITNGSMPSNSANNKPSKKFPAISIKKATTTTLKIKKSPKSKSKKKSEKPKKIKATATTTVSSLSPLTTPDSPTKRNFKCSAPSCFKAYATKDQLEDHVSLAHKQKCPRCEKSFATQKQLNAHFPSHAKADKGLVNPNMKQCNSCPRYFPNNKSLTSHQHKEHNHQPKLATVKKVARPGRCKICSKIVMDVSAHLKQQHPEAAISQPKPAPSKVKSENENQDIPAENTNPSSPSTTEHPTNGNTVEKLEETEKTNLKTENSNSPQADASPENTNEKKKEVKAPLKLVVPSFATIPKPVQTASTTVTGPATASSKYQFKNLLKIGDAEKN